MNKITKMTSHNSCKGEEKHYHCSFCHDMGWTLVKEPFYGYKEPTMLEYAVPCTKCNAGKAYGNESEMPDALSEASMKDFRPDIYNANMQTNMKIFSDFCMNLNKWQAENKGLYLWSKECGSGKTFLACCLANSARAKNHVSIKYTTTTKYIDKCFRKDGNVKDEVYPYKHCDILILDDLGVEKQSDWQRQCIFDLIDYRYTNMKLMIITANASIDDLNVGNRIISRIYKCALPIHFPEESIRRKKAEAENKKFLKNILSRAANG